MEDRWTSLDEEEHFGAMKHCLERERLLVASGTIGTNRAWAGRRLLGIQEYWSLILQDNVQSHNSIQFTQSMWISNAPSMLQVKEMRVGQMGWGVEDQRSGHWAGSSAVPLSQLEYCIYSSNILHTVQYNQMIYVEVKYASVITGKRCWRLDIELDCGVEGCTLAECAKLPAFGVWFTLLISIQHLWWVTTCKPWTMNNLGNLLILPAFNEYSPFNENHVISMCNAGCSQRWWAESRSKWRRWAVEWAGSSQWGGEGLKMGKRKRVSLLQKSEAMKNQTWDCDGMEGSNDRIRNITFQLSFDPCISFIQHLWWVTPHLEHEWPWKFVDFVWLLITNIPCYIELLSQCTMQVAYKAGEQSWWKQSILRSWTGSSQWGRDWLKMDQGCREWRIAVNEKRAAVGRHQSGCLQS